MLVVTDTIPTTDTTFTNNDSIQVPQNQGQPIDAVIMYECQDSMRLSMKDQLIFMYGTGKITTAGIELNSDVIEIDMDKNEVYAHGSKDTATNKTIGKPQFSQGSQSFTAGSMRYNFETKKGVVTDVMTEEAGGFLHGDTTKIHSNEEIHIKHGKYTTCDKDHPHFYVNLTKAKVIPKDKIITGPFNFVIADVPLPVGLPFGFFPNNQKHTSGIILPSYKDELQRGFGLVGGGYYFAKSDYYDLELLGDIFTKGSFGFQVNSNFKKRYKFNGSARIHYNRVQTGERVLNDTEISNTMNIALTYNQDPKARPTSNFSANVNLMKGNHRQYNATDINDFVNSTTSSSVSYRKTFRGWASPFNMSMNANATQNLRDSTINLQLPTISFNMSKFYISKLFNKNTGNKWYDKIGISFTSNLQNKVFTEDSLIWKIYEEEKQQMLFKKMESGFKYDVPLNTSFKVFEWINVSPSLNYHGRIYPNRIKKSFYEDTDSLVTDTIWGFNHNADFSFSMPLSTKLYGLFQINKGRVKAMRHVASPTIGYTYKPDFSQGFWNRNNIYQLEPTDTTGQNYYSVYQNGIFGRPSMGEQQNLTFGLSNNFELKLASKNDTIDKDTKIKLLDQLSINSSYNFAADSLNLSVFSLRASTRLYKSTSINFNGSLDPYTLNADGKRINTFEWTANRNLARFTNARLTVSSGISSKEFQKTPKGKGDRKGKPQNNSPDFYDPYSYYDAVWSVKANYSLNYNRKLNTETQEYETDITQNVTTTLNLQPTDKWNIGVSSGYDFDAMRLTSTTINMGRDLHCWEMSLMVTPYGKMKSYLFNIKIKSSVFNGVEYKRQTSWHDNF